MPRPMRGAGCAIAPARRQQQRQHAQDDERTHQETVMTSAVALSVVPRVIASSTSFVAPSSADGAA